MYHINPNDGTASPCRAKHRCPYTSLDEHYASAPAARAAYELSMSWVEPSPHTWQQEWFSDLTEDELSALSMFGKPHHHRGFNQRLRDQAPNEDDLHFARGLDSALEKAPRGQYVPAYRGLMLSQDELDQVKRTGAFANAGYSSASTKESIAHMFAEDLFSDGVPVVLELATQRRSFLDLGEKEILLPRNTNFAIDVISDRIVRGKTITVLTADSRSHDV